MRAPNFIHSTTILLALSTVAATAEAAPRHRFDLPGGRLGDALVALGRQSGVSIGVSDPELARLRVAGVRGSFTVEQALRRLLRGKEAGFLKIDAMTIRVFRRPARRVREPASPPRIARQTPRRPAATPTPATPAETEEIVITASKRLIGLNSYPGSVQVLRSEALLANGASIGTNGLVARLPALTSTHFGPGRNKLFIRGIADSSFSGPTQATASQYLGETRVNYNAPDPDLRLYDLDRVEVLAGPHGTLYGAGSLGGIIRMLPNAPKLGEVEAAVSAGASYIRHGSSGGDLAGMLNVPLAAGRAGLRVAAYASTEGGYIDDLERSTEDVNRTRIWGGRVAARADAGDGWIVDLSLTGQQIRGADAQYADHGSTPLTRRTSVGQPFENDYGLADIVVTKDWNSLRLVTTAGVVRQKLLERFDATRFDFPPAVVDQLNRVGLFTFESRLSQQLTDGAGWIGGVSFVQNDLRQSRAFGPPENTLLRNVAENRVREAALFGEGSVELTDEISATLGGRVTHSRLSREAPSGSLAGSRTETMFLPTAALSAKPHPELLLFLRYQEAYRPGGLAIRGTSVRQFNNDRVRAAEAGLRYGASGISLFDAALSFAYTQWSDVQADVIDPEGAPSTVNIGDGRIYTADVSLGWRPFAGLSLAIAAVFNDSQVTYGQSHGGGVLRSPLPNVASVNARAAAEYRTSLAFADLHFWSAARYVGRSRLGVGPILGEKQGGWLDLSLGARVESGRHAFAITMDNLLDQTGNRFALGSPYRIVDQRQITPLRPRAVRVGWETSF
jgi:iron complex outermembrane recepter protein